MPIFVRVEYQLFSTKLAVYNNNSWFGKRLQATPKTFKCGGVHFLLHLFVFASRFFFFAV